jgi:hypothetical protein
MNMSRRVSEINEYKHFKRRAVVLIQSVYRGHRARVLYRIAIFQIRKKNKNEFNAATKINNSIRVFLCKAQLRQLKLERLEKWMADARNWSEMWEEDSQNWYYYNNYTGETIWEPSSEGYVKHDGKLVLSSGQIVDDPLNKAVKLDVFGNPIVDEDDDNNNNMTDKQKRKLCSECSERVAIRSCNECGDKFCTKVKLINIINYIIFNNNNNSAIRALTPRVTDANTLFRISDPSIAANANSCCQSGFVFLATSPSASINLLLLLSLLFIIL